MNGLIVFFICLFVLASVLAQPERSYHWPPHGQSRLHRICKRYRESPMRDYYGRIRRCVYSYPPCPWGGRCRRDYGGYESVCCRRRWYPFPYRRDRGRL